MEQIERGAPAPLAPLAIAALADVEPATDVEAPLVAREAGLLYVTGDEPGFTRRRAGKGFFFIDPDGRRVADPATLRRIRTLAIPPAWREVWIAADPEAHIQATGRDAKGRKQYRYHPRWTEVRDSTKFAHMIEFAEALPAIRARIEADMARPALSRERVLASVVFLLEATLIRIGNEDYARQNGSYGLTTLRTRHVALEGAELCFVFTGKSGKRWRLQLRDRRIARMVRALQELPGQTLFRYLGEDGAAEPVTSADVNAYLREISGRDITAKDFRTWAGTMMAAAELRDNAFSSATEAKRNVTAAIARIAQRLGNTPAICRRCYVHPHVLTSYLSGALTADLAATTAGAEGLKPDEQATLALLRTASTKVRERLSA